MPGATPPGAGNHAGAAIGEFDRFHGSHFERTGVFDGVEWSWVVAGEQNHEGAEATLLLPPEPGFSALLGGMIDSMHPGIRMIVPTYPAIPDSRALVEGLASVCRTERVQQLNLVGFGFGGVLAQLFAKRGASVVNKVVLVNTTTPEAWVHASERARYNAARKAPAWVLRRWIAGRRLMHAAPPKDERGQWKRLIRECMVRRKDKWEVLSLAAAGLDAQREAIEHGGWSLEGYKGRIQIIESGADRVVTPAQRGALKEACPFAHVRKVPEAGHWLGCLDSQRLVGLVETFLNEVDIIDRTPGGGR